MGKTDEVKTLVFPSDIDGALETEVRKLQDRYSELLHGDSTEKIFAKKNRRNRTLLHHFKIFYAHLSIRCNKLPLLHLWPGLISEMERKNTISFYNKNHQEYFDQTYKLDLSDIYEKFTYYISRGALILDAGCGVGRDTRYFIRHE